jgi:hypothetical protein
MFIFQLYLQIYLAEGETQLSMISILYFIML